MVSKFLGFKIVVRSSAPIDYINNDNSLVRKIKLFIKIKIYSFSNLIISNSKKSAKKIRAKLANKKKVISISNPIEKLEKTINKQKKKNIILYVGRLSVEKGVYELVEAFTLFQKNFPSFLLHIVGDGNQKKN